MPSRDLSYVLDILNAARLAQTLIVGVSKLLFPISFQTSNACSQAKILKVESQS